MNEHLEEQISRFVDDEMSAGECELFVRRLERDADARQRFARYHMVGDVLRGEHRHLLASAAGAGSVPVQAAASSADASMRSNAPWLLGSGLAAGLAMIVLVGLQMAGSGPDSDISRIASADSEETDMQYMMHHASHMSGLSRTMTQSNLIIAEDASLEPEAESDSDD